MKKKYIVQSIIIILEICLIPGIIVLISHFCANITDLNEGLTRFLTFTAIYEFLVFLINQNQLDSRKDSLLVCKTILRQCILLIDYPNNENLKNAIIDKIEKLNDTSYYFIHQDILDILNKLESIIEDNSIYNMKSYLENELILIEHKYEVENLSWNNTLFLKLFK